MNIPLSHLLGIIAVGLVAWVGLFFVVLHFI